ncbi:MAG TPA: hypothetical protein VGB50_07420 [Flavobacterium sp.]
MKNIGKFKVAFFAALACFVLSCKDNASNSTGAEGTEYNSADGMGEGDATSPGSNMDTDGTGGSGTMNDSISGGAGGTGTGAGGTGTGSGGTGSGSGTGTGGTGSGTGGTGTGGAGGGTGAGGAGTSTGTP